ncbi:hypothetical protein ABE527_10830 [Brucella sp. TWI432]
MSDKPTAANETAVSSGLPPVKSPDAAVSKTMPEPSELFCMDSNGAVMVNQRLAEETLGSSDPHFIEGIVVQMIETGHSLKVTSYNASAFTASLVAGVKPRDQVETMLAAQMAAIHNATMKLAARINRADTIPQYDSASRSLNQLSRTFTAQVDALTRYRSGGQQKMTVEHVHVYEGGQAIVGNVSQGGKRGGNHG